MCEPVTIAALTASAASAGTAATAAAGLTAMQAISLAATVGSGVMGAVGAINQGKAAEATARNNATMAEQAAQDAQRRGEQDATEIQRRGASLKSSQRVSLAAKGLDLGYGTAADLQDQTDFFTQSDAATARTNAGKEAWSLRAGGQQALAEGRAEKRNSQMAATGSLLGTAGSVAGKWYEYRGK